MTGERKRRTTAIVLMSLALLAACGREDANPTARSKPGAGGTSQAREGALDLLLLSPAPAAGWAKDFESTTSCKLRIRAVSGAAELLAQAGQAEVDLVLAGGDLAHSLVAAGLVQQLDPTRVPALASIEPRARDVGGALVDGRRYGVPWLWQPNGIAYATSAFPDAPPGWQDLFEPAAPEGEPAGAGRVLASAEPIALADAALYLAATRPELRIRDPYALDERQYAAAIALLRRQKPLLRGYWRNDAMQAEGFRNGVVASAATPAQARALHAKGLAVAWTAPAGASSSRVEIAMLHNGARHPNCAYAWLEWSLKPASQAILAAAAGALPLVPAACGLEPLAAADACVRDGMALLPATRFHRVPQARCGRGRCVPYSRWTRDYLALVGD